MSINIKIRDGLTGKKASVQDDGGLSVSPAAKSKAYNATLDVANQVYNVVPLKAINKFIITDIFVKANRQVSNTVDATVEIYEASSSESGTVIENLFTIPMIRGETFTFNSIYLEVADTSYINARTDDDDVYVTILGYYHT